MKIDDPSDEKIIVSINVNKKNHEEITEKKPNFSAFVDECIEKELKLIQPTTEELEDYVLQLEGEIEQLEGKIKQDTALRNIAISKNNKLLESKKKELQDISAFAKYRVPKEQK